MDARSIKAQGDELMKKDPPYNVRKWIILFNISIALFMAMLDGSIVNIALPAISKDLGVTISSIQWVITSYLLTVSVLLLIWGNLSDSFGNRKILIFGLFTFTLGSIFCGIASSLQFLIMSRIIQGLGGSAILALTQSIVTSTFSANERGKALGFLGTTVAIGSLLGPSLGGILINSFGWHSIFLVNIPVGFIGIIITLIVLKDDKKKNFKDTRKFDFKGSALLILTIVLVFTSLLFVQEGRLPVKFFIPVFIISILLLIVFIRYENSKKDPLLNTKIFKIKVFSFGITSAYLSFVALNSTLLFIPFYFQFCLGLNVLSTGLLLSFYPGTIAVVAPFCGWISDKITYRPLTVTGLFINTCVFFLFTRLDATSSHKTIAILLIILGIGSAFFQSPNNSSIMGAVKKEHLGTASSISALFRHLGMASGATFSVLIFTFTTKMNISKLSGSKTTFDALLFLHGFRLILIFAALACLVGAVICLIRSVTVIKGSKNS